MEVVWIRALKVGRVQSPKGNILQSMGRAVDRQHYLLAEECLFLLERGSIVLYAVDDDDADAPPANGCVPLSVQEAYEQLLDSDDLRWIDYVVRIVNFHFVHKSSLNHMAGLRPFEAKWLSGDEERLGVQASASGGRAGTACKH